MVNFEIKKLKALRRVFWKLTISDDNELNMEVIKNLGFYAMKEEFKLNKNK